MFRIVTGFVKNRIRAGIIKRIKRIATGASVDVNTMKLIIPVVVKFKGEAPNIPNIESTLNNLIDRYVEPITKNILNFEVDLKITAEK